MKMLITSISSDDNDILMEAMRDTIDTQDEPKVGIFWYNPERNRLVGVSSVYAADLSYNAKGRKTLRTLRHTAWLKIRKNAILDDSNDKIWLEEDYTQVPRGRVFQIDRTGTASFEVLVGSWIHEYPQAAQLIVDEFNLKEDEFYFVESEHWNVGRGTSEIFI